MEIRESEIQDEAGKTSSLLAEVERLEKDNAILRLQLGAAWAALDEVAHEAETLKLVAERLAGTRRRGLGYETASDSQLKPNPEGGG